MIYRISVRANKHNSANIDINWYHVLYDLLRSLAAEWPCKLSIANRPWPRTNENRLLNYPLSESAVKIGIKKIVETSSSFET